jgi:hypothetical protein
VRTKPSFTWRSSFGDDFQVGSDYVFGDDYRVKRDYLVNRDYYRVNKDCARIRNKASVGISKAATPCSVTITESTGIVRTDKTRYQLGKQFW